MFAGSLVRSLLASEALEYDLCVGINLEIVARLLVRCSARDTGIASGRASSQGRRGTTPQDVHGG